MAKKRPKKKKQPAIPPLKPERYERYYYALEQGEDAFQRGDAAEVYWDIGSGERPDVVLSHFRQVARKENIPVTIEIASRDGQSLIFKYNKANQPHQAVRIKNKDGVVVAEKDLK